MRAQIYNGNLRERNKQSQVVYNSTLKGKFQGWKNHLKQRYGLDPCMWMRYLERQCYLCALCNKTFSGQRISVDHNHDTGAVRGLVHQVCNGRLSWYETNRDRIGVYLAELR